MPYTNLNDAIARLDEIETTAAAYGHAMGVLSLDAATAAPLDSAEGRGKTMALLSNVIYELAASADTRELIEFLTANWSDLIFAEKVAEEFGDFIWNWSFCNV